MKNKSLLFKFLVKKMITMPYRKVSIPEEFWKRIENIVNKHPEYGYSSVAEFVKEAVRRRLDEIERDIREKSLARIKKESG